MAAASTEKPSGREDGAEGTVDEPDLRKLPSYVLLEKSRRMQRGLGIITARLPDGGARYRLRLDGILREIDRRKAEARAVEQDDVKSERIVQSRCAESSATISDFRSSFGIDEEAGIDVSHSEIRSTSTGEPKTLIDHEGSLCEEEHSCKPTMPSSLSRKDCHIDSSTDMENINAVDDGKDNGCYRTCKHSQTSRKRKGDSSPSFSMRLRPRKVEEVVLLDGDTCISNSAEKTSSAWDAMKIYYPSWDNPCSVELSHDDMKCVEPESLLSSTILNFYIMYLLGSTPSTSRLRGKYHIFNTYFFSKLEALTSKVDQAAYFLKMRRWWKGVDIFQKAYLIFPVHADTHWSLVIICMPTKEDKSGPIILHLDSLKFHNSKFILNIAERFLKEEWSYLKETGSLEYFHLHESVWRNLPRNIWKKSIEVPQQGNDYDCGLFVLYYMKRFIEEAPERLHKKDISKFGKRWFQPEEASALRKELRALLLQLFEEAKHNNDMTEPASRERPLEGGTSTQPAMPGHTSEVSSSEPAATTERSLNAGDVVAS
ncbi:hypothetical protein ABZP36_021267 [Zizania latifolia]